MVLVVAGNSALQTVLLTKTALERNAVLDLRFRQRGRVRILEITHNCFFSTFITRIAMPVSTPVASRIF